MTDASDIAEPRRIATGDLYTMDDAARLKGVSYHTVSRAVRRGLLPAQRLGKMVFISVTDLQAWKPMVERAPRKFRARQHAAEVAPTPLALASSERAVLAVRLSALLHISEVAISDQPLPVILGCVCEKLAVALDLRRVAIWHIDGDNGVARRVAAVGKPIGTDATTIALSEEPQLAGFLRRGDSAIVAQPEKMERRLPHMLRLLPSVLIVPLRVGAVQRGWIFADRDGDAFDLQPDDLGFAQAIGNQVALILERR
jgi:excisionase family DNA binding protein